MTVETATYVPQLNATLPTDNDQESEGAAHLRLLKSALHASFTGLQNKAVTSSSDDLNSILGLFAFLQAAAGGPWANIQGWVAGTFDTPALRNTAISQALATSPVLGGNPTVASTVALTDNSQRIASTAFVQSLLAIRRVYQPAVLSGAGGAVTGTFNTPSGVVLMRVRMVGAGGGGGGASNNAPTAGGTGYASQFGNAICWGGAGGGIGFSSVGIGGAGGSFTPTGTGADWTTGVATNGANGGTPTNGSGAYPGGEGGDSLLGIGGMPNGAGSGNPPAFYGGGGAGGAGWPSAWFPSGGGGAGASSELWYVNPASAYYYQVGLGGPGGSRGGNGGAYDGATGGAGLILVEMW